MKPKTIYLLLCLAGLVVPYCEFVPWLLAHGLNLPLFARELFSTRVGAFFGLDVIMSAVVVLVLIRVEGARLDVRGRGWVVLALLSVGVSLALPLLLYLRESAMERHAPAQRS